LAGGAGGCSAEQTAAKTATAQTSKVIAQCILAGIPARMLKDAETMCVD